MPRRLLLLMLGGALLAYALPAEASAGMRSCGTERALSDGAVFKIRAKKATCATAKQVGGGWYELQSQGESAKYIHDADDRRWKCRVTEEATGTDPGYNPYTSVRCAHGGRLVTFKLRS
jgi:hypothetical protein